MALVKKKWIWIAAAALVLIAGGAFAYFRMPTAANAEQEDAELPQIDKTSLLIYSGNKGDTDWADVYVQDGTAAREKIAGDVLMHQARMLYSRNAVLYLDKDNNLYLKEPAKDKVKLSADVLDNSFIASPDESTLLFLKSDSARSDNSNHYGDLYLVENGEEKNKIAADIKVNQYALSLDGQAVAMVDRTGDLYIRQRGDGEKKKIGSDVVQFVLSENGATVAYINDDRKLYYQALSAEDKTGVGTGQVGDLQISRNGAVIAYLGDYKEAIGSDSEEDSSPAMGELYAIVGDGEPRKIGSDVTQYVIGSDAKSIYYTDEENNLFKASLPAGSSNKAKQTAIGKDKLASDVAAFGLAGGTGTIGYIDIEDNLYYKADGMDRVKVASDVTKMAVGVDELLYLNKEGTLYERKYAETDAAKVADEVQAFQDDGYLKRIVYATTNGKIAMLAPDGQTLALVDNADKDNEVHYNNAFLYEKKLRLADVVGIWKQTDEEGGGDGAASYYVEITADGKFNTYVSGETDSDNIKIMSQTPGSISIALGDNEEVDQTRIYYDDENAIDISFVEDGTYTFVRASKEEFDKDYAEQKRVKAEEDAKAAKLREANKKGQDLLDRFIFFKEDSVNAYYSASEDDYAGKTTSYMYMRVTEYKIDEAGVLWIQGAINEDTNSKYWFIASELPEAEQTA